MCRHVAYLGEPRSVAELVLTPPHSLLVQSYAPRHQSHGRVNADGWGVGFYPAGRAEPVRWRSDRPIWNDTSFADVAPVLTSHCIIAAVRDATVGMPVDIASSAPFAPQTPWLVSLNGRIDRSVLFPEHRPESNVDSALLAAVVLERGVEQLAGTVAELGRADPSARLNLLLTDGQQVLATTWGDTLFVAENDSGTVVASEPFDDDPVWVAVPDRHLVRATNDGVTITPIMGSSKESA